MSTRLTTIVAICVLAAGSACLAEGKKPDQDSEIIALALKQSRDDGSFAVLEAESRLDLHEKVEVDGLREDVSKKTPDATKLVDLLIDRNAKPVRLSVKSSEHDGYIVDYDGTYEKYFKKDGGGGGWEKWHAEHPKAYGSTTVSLPAYDAKSGLVLIYVGTQRHWLDGAGYVILYKYEGGKLKELAKFLLWVS